MRGYPNNKMFGQSFQKKEENIKIHVVRSIDDVIVKTFTTGVRDFVHVPIGEAQGFIRYNKFGPDHYIATKDKDIAEEYGLRTIKEFY